ncbi:MAG TPA: transglutaminase-like domain-containing protein [Gemmatimonadota bacterium]|nr:transglutaminase-like domain-containing protein [Gemmatimonadota bacterium]
MTRTLSADDFRALIHLLGDEDDGVVDHARTTLRTAGPVATPYLEIASSTSIERSIRTASRSVLEDIHVDEIEREWVALQAVEEGEALEEGALLLERMLHPERNGRQELARADLAVLAAGAREAVPREAAIAEQVDALRRYLHEACGFHANVENYYDPENSFFTSVVARRTGIPITLALVYLVIGRRIGIPLIGVGMPMHFLVGFRDGGEHRYLDPFYGGREVGRGECRLLLERAGFEPAEAYLQAATVVSILERMARNLIIIYQNGAREEELSRARRFVTILTGAVV